MRGTVMLPDSSNARRDFFRGLLAFAAYLVLSLIFFGRALPGHLFDYYVGRETDPSLYMWSLAWWPYVIRNHLHPFLTNLVWAPYGLNLAWVTCLPLLGVVAMPLTTTLGPLATYNIVSLTLPALSAFTAYLLCRRLSNSFGAALLGGFVFGFSPYVMGQILSHLNLLLVFPIPLAAYLVVRRLQGSLSAIAFVILLTLTLSMQFLLVLEPFAVMTFMGGIAAVIALWLGSSDDRRRALHLLPEIAAAYVITAILMSPYIYYFFARGFPTHPMWPAWLFSADLGNFLVPTPVNAIGRASVLEAISRTFAGNIFEQGACLGPPLIVIALIWRRRHRDEFLTRFLIAMLIASCVLAAGPFLRVLGRPVFPMPWLIVERLPIIKSALPIRLVMYAFLALAAIFTLWFCDPRTGQLEKITGVAATLVMLLPNPAASFWASRAPLPAFFRDGSSRRLLAPKDIVLPLPYGATGMCMMWQAESGMNFRMAAGLTGIQPIEIRRWPVLNVFFGSPDLPDPGTQLKAFLANVGITAIVVDTQDRHFADYQQLLSMLGIAPTEISGVLLYRIPSGAFDRYRSLDAIEMERRAERARFETLVSVTAKYVAKGGMPANLSIAALQNAGLFPPGWTFDLKPDAYRDVWSGPRKGKIGVGVIGSASGLTPLIESYRSDADAVYFPYPKEWSPNESAHGFLSGLFEPVIWGSTTGESLQLMVMTFEPARLQQLAARFASQRALSPGAPPREASR